MSACWSADFACFTASFCVNFCPDVRCGPAARIELSWDSERVISSLTLVYLNSSTKPEMGKLRMLCPYRAMLLKHWGTPNHFLTLELIILSIFSSFVRGMPTMVRGHISLGSSPNCRHQSFSFPGSIDLSMISRPLPTSCLSCQTCSQSFGLAS